MPMLLYDSFVSTHAANSRTKRTVQDYVIMTIPRILPVTALMAAGAFFFSPESPQYLYSMVSHHGLIAFYACAIYENYTLMSWLSTLNYGLLQQLLFLQSCECKLDSGMNKLR